MLVYDPIIYVLLKLAIESRKIVGNTFEIIRWSYFNILCSLLPSGELRSKKTVEVRFWDWKCIVVNKVLIIVGVWRIVFGYFPGTSEEEHSLSSSAKPIINNIGN